MKKDPTERTALALERIADAVEGLVSDAQRERRDTLQLIKRTRDFVETRMLQAAATSNTRQ